MIPHAQGQDPLINPKTRSIEHKVLEGKKAAEFFRADKRAHVCPWAHNACTHTPETAYQISKFLKFGGSDLLASVKLNPKVLDLLYNLIVCTPVEILYQRKERGFPRVNCQGSGRLKARTHVCYLWHQFFFNSINEKQPLASKMAQELKGSLLPSLTIRLLMPENNIKKKIISRKLFSYLHVYIMECVSF